MNEEKLLEILGPIKDRLILLEANTSEENLLELEFKIHRNNDLLKKCEKLFQKIYETEQRLEKLKQDIIESHCDIFSTLKSWADYFSMKSNINFRVNREENTIDHDLLDIANTKGKITL